MKLDHAAAALGAALLLCACSVKEDDQAAATSGEDGAGIARQEAGPTPASEPAPPQAAPVQTQPGPKGTTVDLVRASVTGDVLTVALTYRKEKNDCCFYTKIDEVSVIDDATSQRIGVLKDDQGKWMAAPLYQSDPDQIFFPINDGSAQVWFKFPAPAAGSKTVSINIPEVLPFDAVPITR